jgi:SARP family transcriptional regulator, regulator of embCAB operon
VTYVVELIGGFRIRTEVGEVCLVRRPIQRLVSWLAISKGTVPRVLTATTLWPDLPEDRGLANLRSVCWRVRRELPGLVAATSLSIEIGRDVSVDYLDLERGLDSSGACPETSADALFHDLLPEMHEPWLDLPRAILRYERLQAVDELIESKVTSGELADALKLADRLLETEPLRESTVRLKMRAHRLAGSDESVRQTGCRYVHLLDETLALEPSPAFGRELANAVL